MSAKSINQFEDEKINIIQNKHKDSQIIRYTKDILQKPNLKNSEENNEIYTPKISQNEIDCIKAKLKENLETNLNLYIQSTKSKEQKISELLKIINQYESQINSLNSQIVLLTNNNKQMKQILKNIEINYK